MGISSEGESGGGLYTGDYVARKVLTICRVRWSKMMYSERERAVNSLTRRLAVSKSCTASIQIKAVLSFFRISYAAAIILSPRLQKTKAHLAGR
jgi:hypothetical protein